MAKECSWGRRSLLRGALLAAACGLFVGQPARSADQPPKGEVIEVAHKAVVHVYPEKLTDADKLTDGERGDAIEITGPTTLIWVDLAPDARFAHPTEYVLITTRGSRVVKGQWWPVLNGKTILRGEKESTLPVPITLGDR